MPSASGSILGSNITYVALNPVNKCIMLKCYTYIHTGNNHGSWFPLLYAHLNVQAIWRINKWNNERHVWEHKLCGYFPKSIWQKLDSAFVWIIPKILCTAVFCVNTFHSENLGRFRRLHQTSAVIQYFICVSALHLWYGCRCYRARLPPIVRLPPGSLALERDFPQGGGVSL
jgi:hypothetical protein